jgi:hypothetical protein
MQFRKKPITVEAMQWPPHLDIEKMRNFETWLTEWLTKSDDVLIRGTELYIRTIHGEWAIARPGDYVIREPERGRLYPCAQDVFNKSYDPA